MALLVVDEAGRRDPLLVVLLGPTASGKTALSLALAEAFHGELVNCDSVAVYRGMEIGTAKPSAAERARAPHHLLDVVAPDSFMTAGAYARLARQALAGIVARGHLPIVVGGTGLYLRALLEGLFPGPQRSEPLRERLRATAARRGPAWLHRILRRLDPGSAARIHAHDVSKVVRAIEIRLAAHEPLADAWRRGRDPLAGYRILRLGLDPDRAALYGRIDDRARRMFDAGLVEETRALAALHGADCRPLGSLGYRQALDLLAGRVTPEEAVRQARQGHRNYAKRQMTWFRREPDVHWLKGFGDDPAIESQALALVRAALW